MYQGNGRTKSSARRDAVRRALSCSVQLPDNTVVSNDVMDMTTDFTEDWVDSPTAAQTRHITASRRESSTSYLPSSSLTDSCRSSTNSQAAQYTSAPCTTSSRGRSWFNALAVLHDVRPSARYERQTSFNSSALCVTVTVDGHCFEGFGTTWKAAKRNAASQALWHILQLRHLTSDF